MTAHLSIVQGYLARPLSEGEYGFTLGDCFCNGVGGEAAQGIVKAIAPTRGSEITANPDRSGQPAISRSIPFPCPVSRWF